MWELTWISLGFVLISGGVIALGRRSTAQWERETRGARAARRAAGRAAAGGGPAAGRGRLLAGRVRRGLTSAGSHVPRRGGPSSTTTAQPRPTSPRLPRSLRRRIARRQRAGRSDGHAGPPF